jgi:hypothetical protein
MHAKRHPRQPSIQEPSSRPSRHPGVRPPLWPTCQTNRQRPSQAAKYESNASLSLSLFVLSPHSRVSECRVRQEIRQTCRHRVGQEGRQANIQAHGQANSQAANPQDAVRGTPASFCPSFSLSLSPSLSISLATRQYEQAPPLPLIVFSRSLSLSPSYCLGHSGR